MDSGAEGINVDHLKSCASQASEGPRSNTSATTEKGARKSETTGLRLPSSGVCTVSSVSQLVRIFRVFKVLDFFKLFSMTPKHYTYHRDLLSYETYDITYE